VFLQAKSGYFRIPGSQRKKLLEKSGRAESYLIQEIDIKTLFAKRGSEGSKAPVVQAERTQLPTGEP